MTSKLAMTSKLTNTKPVSLTPDEVDLQRILALPIRRTPDEEDIEIESFERLSVEAFSKGERLLPKQVDALREFEATKGGFFPVGVGFGKSGIALMSSQIAYSRGWAQKILLLVPVHLVSGLIARHIPEWRKRTNLSLTFHILAGQNKAARLKKAESGAPGVYVVPYSLLSATDTVDLLRRIDADMIVADEAHRLKNPRSACTKRLLHVIKEREESGRPPIFVAMSGSFTTKSIMEYHHLIDSALGDNSPLPRRAGTAYTWGLVIDSGAVPTHGLVAGAMGKLINWAHRNFPSEQQLFASRASIDNARNAYRRRMTTCPGVVATSDERPNASLAIMNRDVDSHNERLTQLMQKVQLEYETPEGEPIDHAIHTYKWMYELTSGFYNSLVWPKTEEHARNRKITVEEADSRLTRARSHLKCLQRYHIGLREFFKEAPLGLDTPTDVALAISRGSDRVPANLHELWHDVKAADFQGRPDRLSIPVRIDDFKIKAAVQWAKEFETGLIWVFHHEMGEWLVERLRKEGASPVYAPAGADDLIEGIGDPGRGGKGDKLVVASIMAHGVGRNLQAFQNQLFVEWPRSAMVAEQTLGRVHRTGQKADEVVAHTLIGTEFDEMNRAATIGDAAYVQHTMGSAQRVLYADYDPIPKVYQPGQLRSRGAAPLSMDPALWQKVRELFSA